jgi:TolA-binding protein
MLLLAVSCTGMFEKAGLQEECTDVRQEREALSLRETEFLSAMAKLEKGDFEGARETLSGMAEPEDDQQVEPEVVFALGVIRLLEMESEERMRGCRDYFRAFADDYPDGPYREHAERIVQVLSSHIERAQKEERWIKELTGKVSDQEEVIQTLQYKIEKLEEIHRETEETRQLPDGQ